MRSSSRSDLREVGLPTVLRDSVGLGLAAALAGWVLVTQIVSGGSVRAVALIVATVAVLTGARSLGRRWPWLPPTTVVVAASAVALVSLTDFAAGRSTDRVLEYGNAQAQFFLQAVIAGLMVWASVRWRSARTLALLAVGVFGALALGSGSIAVVLLLGLVVVAVMITSAARQRVFAAGCVILLVGSIALTIVLGVASGGDAGLEGVPEGLETGLQDALTQTRTALWHDALSIMSDHPIFGVGPGRFMLFSTTAASDPDWHWAHNEYLQQGAEEGVAGLVLLLAVFLWVLARLGVAGSGRVGALGIASAAALALHSTIDYVLHFPLLVLMAAALVGTAMTAPAERTG